jgi:hypothetical protein
MKIFKSFIKWLTYGFVEQPAPTQHELQQALEEERKFWNTYLDEPKQLSEELPKQKSIQDKFPGFLITVDGGLKPMQVLDCNYLGIMKECIFNAYKLPSGVITPDVDMVVGGKYSDVLYPKDKIQCVIQ